MQIPIWRLHIYLDDTGELVTNGTGSLNEVQESRVVAVYGISKTNVLPRNIYRRRTYLGSTQKVYAHFGNDYDKRHFIANATGGSLEINLFPQKRAINRGWSEEGNVIAGWRNSWKVIQGPLYSAVLFI